MDDRTTSRARFEARLARALEEIAGPVVPVDAARVARRAAGDRSRTGARQGTRWTLPRWLGAAAMAGLVVAALATLALLQRPTDRTPVVGDSRGPSTMPSVGAPWFLFEGARRGDATPGGARAGGANLYIARADGSDTRLVASGPEVMGARWSPDGAHIGYGSIQGGWTIVDIRDGSVRRVPMAVSECGGPAWSPDGTWLAMFSDPCASLARDTGQYVELSLERADGTGATRLRRTPGTPFPEVLEGFWEGTSALAWSPDGSRIAFGCRDDGDRAVLGLCVANVDEAVIAGGTFTPVRLETPDAVPSDWGWTESAWSADSRWLAAAPRSTTVGRHLGVPGSVVTVPVSGGVGTIVATGDERSAPGRPRLPAWTPDGNAVVYYTYRDGYLPHGSSWTVGADGTGRRQLGIPVGWACPMAVSPDGTRIVAAEFYAGGTLFLGTPDDRPPHLYVSPGESDDGTGNACPSWQPRPVPVGDAIPAAAPAPAFSTTDPRGETPAGM